MNLFHEIYSDDGGDDNVSHSVNKTYIMRCCGLGNNKKTLILFQDQPVQDKGQRSLFYQYRETVSKTFRKLTLGLQTSVWA